MTHRPTDDLLAALSAWMNLAVVQLDQQHLDVLHVCLAAEGADVQIVARLRDGSIVLEATNAGQRLELFREEVSPVRPDDGFGHQSGQSHHH